MKLWDLLWVIVFGCWLAEQTNSGHVVVITNIEKQKGDKDKKEPNNHREDEKQKNNNNTPNQ